MITTFNQEIKYDTPESYAVKHNDVTIRLLSRSGGMFTALSDAVLAEEGVIYGCILAEDYSAVHVRAENEDCRNQMRGSKYIQSDLQNTFTLVKQDLQMGRRVLFSGTSCQIAGLKAYLGKQDLSNLLCVDIVCHGVASPKVWKSFLDWIELTNSGKVEAVVFRNKRDFGWKAHMESFYFDNSPRVDSNIFKTLFLEDNILRPCCYVCPYKSIFHPGDITIADYWGIEKAVPGFSDNKGVSLVLVNNEKGREAFDKTIDMITFQKTIIADCIQPALVAPTSRPESRDAFWKDFSNKDFMVIAKRYGGYGRRNKLKRVLIKIKKRVRGFL